MSKAAHELVLTRLIDVPADKLFRCWTDPNLLKRWFAPKPYTTPVAEMDLRVGGATNMVMKGPDGQEMPNPGTILDVVPGRKLVFTDAYTGDWMPRDGAPLMTAVITFEPEGGKARYTATVRHWTGEDVKKHEMMGFHQGWGICADQLEALARTI
ncbi:MAG: SRPBCC family protein [Rhizomicrobium sp.]